MGASKSRERHKDKKWCQEAETKVEMKNSQQGVTKGKKTTTERHMKNQRRNQCDTCIFLALVSPELSQGSMSSSSLGHSADATSRSSTVCGEKTWRFKKNKYKTQGTETVCAPHPFCLFSTPLSSQKAHPSTTLLPTLWPVRMAGSQHQEEKKKRSREERRVGGRL